ncbi:MAG: ABC transporter permease [Rhodospirillales bacterium]|nr:MAG: ABC transporter permease [Rhodospirillales bacterium]
MAEATAGKIVLTTADGVPLKRKLRQTQQLMKRRAFTLVLPLLAFIGITFVWPIALMVYRGIDNPVLSEFMPNAAEAVLDWDSSQSELPPEEVFAIVARDLVQARKDKTVGKVATRLNYELPGSRSLITSSARKLSRVEDGPWMEAMLKADSDWGKRETWAALQRIAPRYTGSFYLAALDMTYDENGAIVSQPENRQIYVTLFVRTLWVSLFITLACALLAYPISYLMATQPLRISNLLMILVLLPFWTSLLVRTTSWIVLLQTEGVLNDIMVALGLIGDENRIQMIYNMTGTIVAMVHILLPFMVLPLFSVMKTISPSYVRAAQSLGATPARAFWKVYFPQTVPGIGAGSILVFILAIGYYITPALVGGRTGQLISNFIAFHMQKSLNWGLAAALGGILLFGVLALYWLYNRLVGIDNMKLG